MQDGKVRQYLGEQIEGQGPDQDRVGG
jgi:hypothetical protein